MTDLISALYLIKIHFPDGNLQHPDRDRFILSKGHAALALYAVLIELGWWRTNVLDNYGRASGKLGGHPSNSMPGVETSTGALGHGLPFAVGAALGAKAQRSRRGVYVVVGDGELQEGSNWEAAMLAATHNLDNLTVVVDRNGLQQGRKTEEVNKLGFLADKWRAFGWSVEEIDGHDLMAIVDTLQRIPFTAGKPNCIIANTIKGKGVSFMEDRAEWHHKLPSFEQAELALNELYQAPNQ